MPLCSDEIYWGKIVATNPPQRLSTTLVFDIVITIIWLLLCIISIIIVFLIIDTVCMKLTVSSSLLTQDLNCVMMESK